MKNIEDDSKRWLRAMGAIRPMAPASDDVLVLGEWREGFYPVEWYRTRTSTGWRVFGIDVSVPLTREDCKRILRATATPPAAEPGDERSE